MYRLLAETFLSEPTVGGMRNLEWAASVLGVSGPPPCALNDLVAEYRALFVVPNPRYVAPYESVYRDAWEVPELPGRQVGGGSPSRLVKGLLMGESTIAVQECYASVGVVPSQELPDHIGNELRFMAFLWTLEGEDSSELTPDVRTLRLRFCDEHLRAWLDPLRVRILESQRLGFYPVVLGMVHAALDRER